MDQTEALVKTIVEGLQEKKGKNIVTVDLTQLSGSICQYMIICEGSTPTQVSALSDSAWDFAHRKAGEKTAFDRWSTACRMDRDGLWHGSCTHIFTGTSRVL